MRTLGRSVWYVRVDVMLKDVAGTPLKAFTAKVRRATVWSARSNAVQKKKCQDALPRLSDPMRRYVLQPPSYSALSY